MDRKVASRKLLEGKHRCANANGAVSLKIVDGSNPERYFLLHPCMYCGNVRTRRTHVSYARGEGGGARDAACDDFISSRFRGGPEFIIARLGFMRV